MKTIVSVAKMRINQSGEVHEIAGDRETADRLAVLGIHEKIRIRKKNALMGKGPIIVSIGTGEVAVGHALADRILVEVD